MSQNQVCMVCWSFLTYWLGRSNLQKPAIPFRLWTKTCRWKTTDYFYSFSCNVRKSFIVKQDRCPFIKVIFKAGIIICVTMKLLSPPTVWHHASQEALKTSKCDRIFTLMCKVDAWQDVLWKERRWIAKGITLHNICGRLFTQTG